MPPFWNDAQGTCSKSQPRPGLLEQVRLALQAKCLRSKAVGGQI